MTEKAEQAATVKLLSSMGAAVYVLGTTRRRGDHPGTCQSPGLPDLLCFLREPGGTRRRLVVIELKARGGRLRPAQQVFRELCFLADVAHVTGTCDDVITWLKGQQYVG